MVSIYSMLSVFEVSTLPLSISFEVYPYRLCTTALRRGHRQLSSVDNRRRGKRRLVGRDGVIFFQRTIVQLCAGVVCACNSVMSYVCSLIPTKFSWNSGTYFPCCKKISNAFLLPIFCNTEAPGTKPMNSNIEPCNTEVLSKNQQRGCVARLETCT